MKIANAIRHAAECLHVEPVHTVRTQVVVKRPLVADVDENIFEQLHNAHLSALRVPSDRLLTKKRRAFSKPCSASNGVGDRADDGLSPMIRCFGWHIALSESKLPDDNELRQRFPGDSGDEQHTEPVAQNEHFASPEFSPLSRSKHMFPYRFFRNSNLAYNMIAYNKIRHGRPVPHTGRKFGTDRAEKDTSIETLPYFYGPDFG